MDEKVFYSSTPEDFYYMDVNVPCQGACPVGTNIPAYIRAVFEKEYNRSYDINRMNNILPGVLGRICSRPCEDRCRHGEAELGQPVNICHLKRAAADMRQVTGSTGVKIPENGKKIAIIGSGPSGLAAAHDLALSGFDVTIFEALERPGGMLMYGIPEFRLPRDILMGEIDSILDLGVVLETGIEIGRDKGVEELLSGYDAVLSAIGCYSTLRLDIPGEDLENVYHGLDFMMDLCAGKKVVTGQRVLVIGAGFTAFDCARSALRLGARDVTICLRRTEEDLRVTHDEIMETKKEGIKIKSLMISNRILGSDHVEGVEFLRSEPGDKREDGKRSIFPIKGSEFILDTDTVIVATGQTHGLFKAPGERDEHGALKIHKESFQTSIKGFYGTGDYMTGPSTVIEAISLGRKAAQRIAQDLLGRKLYERVVRQEDTGRSDRKRTWDFLPRQEIPTIEPVEERFKEYNREVETGYRESLSLEESKRCYLCYLHYEIDISRCIYCRYCIDVAPRDCIKLVKDVELNGVGAVAGIRETTQWREVNAIMIDNSRCIRCGECVRVCPMDCISVTRVELIERYS